MAHDVEHNRYHQAFEDFLNTEAERAIAEATQHRGDGKRLWVLLFEDGRYEVEHGAEGAPPEIRAEPDGGGEPAIFQVAPLEPGELDPRDPENSNFGPAIDRMWSAFRAAHNRATR